MNIFLKSFLFLCLAGVAAALWVIHYQEYLLFPYFAHSEKQALTDRAEPLPPGIERMIIGDTGEKIELWVKLPTTPPVGTAIIFRANLGTLDEHHSLYEWTTQHGFVTGIFNYPGMGLSDGRPSETNIIGSGKKVFEYLKTRTPPSAKKTWIMGYSIGTGPAAILASEQNPNLLTLFAPYTDLRDVVYSHPFFRIFTPFLRFHFRTKEAIEALEDTDFIVATGGGDTTVLPNISQQVFEYYRGRGKTRAVHNPRGPHDKLLGTNLTELEATLKQFGYE